MFDAFFERLFKHISRINAIHTLLIVFGYGGINAIVVTVGAHYGIITDKTDVIYIGIVLLLLAVILLIFYKLFKHIFIATKYWTRNQVITQTVSEMSYKNSRCDAELFDTFNSAVMGPREGSQPSDGDLYTSSRKIVDYNINDVLDYTAKIFSTYTGHVCCACIKVPRPPKRRGDKKEETLIEVVRRNTTSVQIRND